jgi:demethylmenaquinone methyltransferase/2-methoxy-6-polyprenyl-1,4-benzoquinol methylase
VSSRRNNLPADNEKAALLNQYFDTISPRYQLINRIITFGLDNYWRRQALRKLNLTSASLILDVGCGPGDLINMLNKHTEHLIGLDPSTGMLKIAKSKTNALLIAATAEHIPIKSESLDVIVSAFAMRNFSDLHASIAEFSRILKPSGQLLIIEIAEPKMLLARALFHFWLNVCVPRIGAMLSDKNAYKYLPASLAYLPDELTLGKLAKNNGFKTYTNKKLLFKGCQYFFMTK